MNKPEIINILELLKHLPNSPIKSKESLVEVANMFYVVLQDLPLDMVMAAAVQYLSEENPFFPTPGILRDGAMDLQMLAMGIPTPAEAWAMVQSAGTLGNRIYCEEGAVLREEGIANPNAITLKAYKDHEENCSICDTGGFRESYPHPVVAETVKRLGGRDAILTGNLAADRKQFIDAYREVVAKERTLMSMAPIVAHYVENKRIALEEIALLANKKNVRNDKALPGPVLQISDSREAVFDRGVGE